MLLQIDNRIGSKELSPYISTPHELTRLQYGDVCFMGNGPDNLPWSIGIERKTIMDLVSSMITGRLSGHQLIGLLNCYNKVYILVEGLWRTNPRSGLLERRVRSAWTPVELGARRIMAKEVINYLNTLMVFCGVSIWQTSGLKQSGHWISSVYSWWQKPWEKHTSYAQFHVQAPPLAYLTKPSVFHRMVKELTGVGWERGNLLTEKFKNLQELMTASMEQLQEIPGIGKKLAGSIIKELKGGK